MKSVADYDAATLPPIPAGFEDVSHPIDACPSHFHPARNLSLYVDFADPAEREFPELPRFHLFRDDPETGARTDFISSDDWTDVLAVLMGELFADLFCEDMSPGVIATVRERNASPRYAGSICATHDFCDANQVMADAFAQTMGRDLIMGDDEPGQQDDFRLWGKAWDHAKTHRLSDQVAA